MAIIKKITVYVAIDESKLLNDNYYKERIEDGSMSRFSTT